ncbi:MAG: hypothetical protein LW807_02795 [Proteobacteria bacterium]|jgi:hypothetical protein|nr:hypothetical protein [Pseudomonadota bacterium]
MYTLTELAQNIFTNIKLCKPAINQDLKLFHNKKVSTKLPQNLHALGCVKTVFDPRNNTRYWYLDERYFKWIDDTIQ